MKKEYSNFHRDLVLPLLSQKVQRIYLFNWQPLTLQDMVYKLVSSIFASRLQLVLENLIGPHKKAYIPGWFIGTCTRRTYDIFSHTKTHNLPGILVLIEFERDFDLISFCSYWNPSTYLDLVKHLLPGQNFRKSLWLI